MLMSRKERYSRIDKYILKQVIGSGGFGKVKIAVHEETGVHYACKIIDKDKVNEPMSLRQVQTEINIMQGLNHRNIVSLVSVLASPTKIFLILELITGGELASAINRHYRLNEPYARFFFHQLIDGVEHCHRHGVYHRDLKPENLLLDQNGNLKIADFGLSSLKNNANSLSASVTQSFALHTQCGTVEYSAPEIITIGHPGFKGTYSGSKVDIWACGVVLFVMCSGTLPFDGNDPQTLLKKILHAKVIFPDYFSPELRDLISNLLKRRPKQRYNLEQVRMHPWFMNEEVTNYQSVDVRPLSQRQLTRQKTSSRIPSSKQSEEAVAAKPESHAGGVEIFSSDKIDIKINAKVVEEPLSPSGDTSFMNSMAVSGELTPSGYTHYNTQDSSQQVEPGKTILKGGNGHDMSGRTSPTNYTECTSAQTTLTNCTEDSSGRTMLSNYTERTQGVKDKGGESEDGDDYEYDVANNGVNNETGNHQSPSYDHGDYVDDHYNEYHDVGKQNDNDGDNGNYEDGNEGDNGLQVAEGIGATAEGNDVTFDPVFDDLNAIHDRQNTGQYGRASAVENHDEYHHNPVHEERLTRVSFVQEQPTTASEVVMSKLREIGLAVQTVPSDLAHLSLPLEGVLPPPIVSDESSVVWNSSPISGVDARSQSILTPILSHTHSRQQWDNTTTFSKPSPNKPLSAKLPPLTGPPLNRLPTYSEWHHQQNMQMIQRASAPLNTSSYIEKKAFPEPNIVVKRAMKRSGGYIDPSVIPSSDDDLYRGENNLSYDLSGRGNRVSLAIEPGMRRVQSMNDLSNEEDSLNQQDDGLSKFEAEYNNSRSSPTRFLDVQRRMWKRDAESWPSSMQPYAFSMKTAADVAAVDSVRIEKMADDVKRAFRPKERGPDVSQRGLPESKSVAGVEIVDDPVRLSDMKVSIDGDIEKSGKTISFSIPRSRSHDWSYSLRTRRKSRVSSQVFPEVHTHGSFAGSSKIESPDSGSKSNDVSTGSVSSGTTGRSEYAHTPHSYVGIPPGRRVRTKKSQPGADQAGKSSKRRLGISGAQFMRSPADIMVWTKFMKDFDMIPDEVEFGMSTKQLNELWQQDLDEEELIRNDNYWNYTPKTNLYAESRSSHRISDLNNALIDDANIEHSRMLQENRSDRRYSTSNSNSNQHLQHQHRTENRLREKKSVNFKFETEPTATNKELAASRARRSGPVASHSEFGVGGIHNTNPLSPNKPSPLQDTVIMHSARVGLNQKTRVQSVTLNETAGQHVTIAKKRVDGIDRQRGTQHGIETKIRHAVSDSGKTAGSNVEVPLDVVGHKRSTGTSSKEQVPSTRKSQRDLEIEQQRVVLSVDDHDGKETPVSTNKVISPRSTPPKHERISSSHQPVRVIPPTTEPTHEQVKATATSADVRPTSLGMLQDTSIEDTEIKPVKLSDQKREFKEADALQQESDSVGFTKGQSNSNVVMNESEKSYVGGPQDEVKPFRDYIPLMTKTTAIDPFGLDIPTPKGLSLPSRLNIVSRISSSPLLVQKRPGVRVWQPTAHSFQSLLQPASCRDVMNIALRSFGCKTARPVGRGDRWKIKCEFPSANGMLKSVVTISSVDGELLTGVRFRRKVSVTNLGQYCNGTHKREFDSFYRSVIDSFCRRAEEHVERSDAGALSSGGHGLANRLRIKRPKGDANDGGGEGRGPRVAGRAGDETSYTEDDRLTSGRQSSIEIETDNIGSGTDANTMLIQRASDREVAKQVTHLN